MTEFWKQWKAEAFRNKQVDVFDFKLFKIVCQKCNSDNVEINGDCEAEQGYYNEIENKLNIIVKCHNCGSAMLIHNNYEAILRCKK
jgi:Zn finger protein HypA/HybF involved in hydrogenase expression